LKIEYKSNRLKRACTDFSVAKRDYGVNMANLIHQRVNEISSADSVEMLCRFSIGKCHPLEGNRTGQYAMNLVQPYRLVFEKICIEEEGRNIEIVRILSIENYH